MHDRVWKPPKKDVFLRLALIKRKDNHPGNHPDVKLPEPRLAETEALINTLKLHGIRVYRKTIRKARDEQKTLM